MKPLAWLLSFSAGFLSLSQEILWVRLVGFVQQGVPQSFSLVLGLYLLGIALGASWGKRLCETPDNLARTAGLALLLAGVIDLALPDLLTAMADGFGPVRFVGTAVLIVVTAAAKAVLFPIAHHMGSEVEGGRLGRSLARVYFLNILGSTLGPLLTGFVLLDYISLESGFRWIGAACIGVALVALVARRPAVGMALASAVAAVAMGAIAPKSQDVVSAYAERMADGRLKSVVSNRHGLLHVVDGGLSGDIVYGGNVYDGRTNTDLAVNSNRIDRAYVMTALHAEPRRILVIGLSSGAWLRVLSAMPSVQEIDVIEINPGYVEMIRAYPPLASTLRDSRVRLHIDDGRRWLNRHADARFDLIVMNTTFHWRANVTNLLSQQFMGLAAKRLAPGGVFAFNATGSVDALATAASVFPHAYRWSNFVYAARHDFRPALSPATALKRIEALALDGQALVPLAQPAYREAADRMLAQPFVDLAEARRTLGRPPEVIDDWTMPTEFRYGRGLNLW